MLDLGIALVNSHAHPSWATGQCR